MIELRVAEGYTQLVAHLLAHVPLAGPGNLADARYARFVAPHLRGDERALLEHDAGLLAALWAADPRLDALHGLVELHRDLEGFRATAARALAEVRAEEVASPELLAQLHGLPAAELVHATLALLDDRFASMREVFVDAALARAVDDVQPWLARLHAHVPELAAQPIELVFAMGPHGRALPRRIVVGAPVAWNGLDPLAVAVQAAHEALVRACPHEGYVAVERWALAELPARLRADPNLHAGHARWRAGLDCSGLE